MVSLWPNTRRRNQSKRIWPGLISPSVSDNPVVTPKAGMLMPPEGDRTVPEAFWTEGAMVGDGRRCGTYCCREPAAEDEVDWILISPEVSEDWTGR